MVYYKLEKEYIIFIAFSKFASINTNFLFLDLNYVKLNILFTYSTTLVKLYLSMLVRIIKNYKQNN